MASIKTKLSVGDIKNTIERLSKLKSNLNNVSEDILDELAEKTRDKAEENYDALPFDSTHAYPYFEYKRSKNKAVIYAKGNAVIYDEYGTGRWAERKHIGSSRAFINSGGHYWFMPKDKAELYNYGNTFTVGNPAGHYMYDTDVWLRENYKQIAKEKVDDVVSKV